MIFHANQTTKDNALTTCRSRAAEGNEMCTYEMDFEADLNGVSHAPYRTNESKRINMHASLESAKMMFASTLLLCKAIAFNQVQRNIMCDSQGARCTWQGPKRVSRHLNCVRPRSSRDDFPKKSKAHASLAWPTCSPTLALRVISVAQHSEL